ncbi:MAG: hypothetical protein U1F56_19075 [Rubrivivax sp.]
MQLPRHLWPLAALCPLVATATPTFVNGDIYAGAAAFDAAVHAAGGQVQTQPLQGLAFGASQWRLADFTIRSTNGWARFVEPDYHQMRALGQTGALSGWAIGLTVNEPAPQWGLSFEFDQPVNAFGLEVGDWATCCFDSALYIAFDGGAVREVATAHGRADNPGWVSYGHATNFVGAFDTGGSFTRVTFYGAGVGEYMVGGGTIRYALLDASPPGDEPRQPLDVPEPAGWALVLAGLAAMDASLRRGRRLALRHMRERRSRLLSPG